MIEIRRSGGSLAPSLFLVLHYASLLRFFPIFFLFFGWFGNFNVTPYVHIYAQDSGWHVWIGLDCSGGWLPDFLSIRVLSGYFRVLLCNVQGCGRNRNWFLIWVYAECSLTEHREISIIKNVVHWEEKKPMGQKNRRILGVHFYFGKDLHFFFSRLFWKFATLNYCAWSEK